MSVPPRNSSMGVLAALLSAFVFCCRVVCAGAPIPLHEMEPGERLAAIMRLMDTPLGAEALGDYVKQAHSEAALVTARNVAEIIGARASSRRTENEKKRIVVFALAALENPDEEIRVKALDCVRRSGLRGVADNALAEHFKAESDRVRKAALEAAVSVGGRALLEPLSDVVFDEKRAERERLAAVQALGGIPSGEVVALLKRAAGLRDKQIAVNAVTSIARIAKTEAVQPLLESAGDGRAEVRLAAYRGLADFRLTRGFPYGLVRALETNLPKEKGSSEVYLLRLLCACGEQKALRESESRLGSRGLKPSEAMLLVEGLGLSGLSEAFPIVKAVAGRSAGDEQMLRQCYLAAGRIGTSEAVDWLVGRIEEEAALSAAVVTLFDALTLAGSVPADGLLPLLTSPGKKPPRHLLPLAIAGGPLDATEKTLAAFGKVFAQTPSDRLAATGLVLLARRNVGAALKLVDGDERLKPLLEAAMDSADAPVEVAWGVALYGSDDDEVLARLLAQCLSSGRPVSPLGRACAWNRGALAAALGAWEDLPWEERSDCISAMDLKYGLSLLSHLESLPAKEVKSSLAFLLNVQPHRAGTAEGQPEETAERQGRLVRVGKTLRWEEEEGVLRTPVVLMPLDMARREEIASRLLEFGVMVIDEPFMAADIAVVANEGDEPDYEAKAVITLLQAAAIAGLKE